MNDVAAMQRVRLRRKASWDLFDAGELWRYRDLLWQLALRDVRIRYKQTLLGIVWAVLQPVLTMAIFTVIFGRFGGFDQRVGPVPYSLFTLAALIPWQMFSGALTNASNSLVLNQNLITKVYFPRVIVPIATVLGNVIDALISSALIVLLILVYRLSGTRVPLSPWIILLPLLLIATFVTAVAVGLWLAALNVEYRDVRYAIPFLAQLWMFATPVAYPSALIRSRSPVLYRLYSLNPMVGIVDAFRAALFGLDGAWGSIVISGAVTLVLLATGLIYFRSMERGFADVI